LSVLRHPHHRHLLRVPHLHRDLHRNLLPVTRRKLRHRHHRRRRLLLLLLCLLVLRLLVLLFLLLVLNPIAILARTSE